MNCPVSGFSRRMRSLYSPPRPHVAVLVDGHVVGPGARRRRAPFLEAFGPRVEHPDSIGAVLAKPEAILRVHHAAPRSRARRRRLVDRDLPGLRVDSPDRRSLPRRRKYPLFWESGITS